MFKNIPYIVFLEKDLPTQDFELLSLAQLFEHKSTTHDPYKPHRLAFFAILMITQGEVHHQLDFETHVLSSGGCLLISPGQVHAFDKNAMYTGYLVHWNLNIFTYFGFFCPLSSLEKNRVALAMLLF